MSTSGHEADKLGPKKIRAAKQDDVPAIVEIHIRAFPNFFLSFLGRGFLKTLYSGILHDECGVVLVSESSDRITGFAAGTIAVSGFYRRLWIRSWFRFGCASFVAAMRKPVVAPRLFRALRKTASQNSTGPVALLMSIAVDVDEQTRGTGKSLVSAFCTACQKRGQNQISLTTDRIANDRVNRFYASNGFRLVQHYTTPEGREMNEYIINLSPGSPSAAPSGRCQLLRP